MTRADVIFFDGNSSGEFTDNISTKNDIGESEPPTPAIFGYFRSLESNIEKLKSVLRSKTYLLSRPQAVLASGFAWQTASFAFARRRSDLPSHGEQRVRPQAAQNPTRMPNPIGKAEIPYYFVTQRCVRRHGGPKMKQKTEITVRIDGDLLAKASALADIEGQSLNNHIVSLIRQSVQYHERVHGKIDVSKAQKEAKL